MAKDILLLVIAGVLFIVCGLGLTSGELQWSPFGIIAAVGLAAYAMHHIRTA